MGRSRARKQKDEQQRADAAAEQSTNPKKHKGLMIASEEEAEAPVGGSGAFQSLLASLSTAQYSSEEEEDQPMSEESVGSDGEEEDDGEEEEDDGEEEEDDGEDEEDDGEDEEDDYDSSDLPETLTRSLRRGSGDEEEEDSNEEDEEDSNEEDEDDDEAAADAADDGAASAAVMPHPFSNPLPPTTKVHDTFECDAEEEEEDGDDEDSSSNTVVYSLTGRVPATAAPPPLPLKGRLKHTWDVYQDAKARGDSLLMQKLLPVISSYGDVMFEARDLFNASELREMYTVHVANHLFTHRDLVMRHDTKRSTSQPGSLRDQGFTRARVLVLLPYKSSAFRFIKLLLELFPKKTRVKNLDRFVEEFGPSNPEEEDGEEGEEQGDQDWRAFQRHCKSSESYTERDFAEGTHPCMREDEEENGGSGAGGKKKQRRKTNRPADWHACFEENAEEDFRVGLSMLSTKSVKLYSGFYESDLIVASPLGLRLATKQAMETKGEAGEDDGEDKADAMDEDEINEDEILDDDASRRRKKMHKGGKKGGSGKEEEEDVDFLSSIEVLVIDEADVYHTQNWQHLEDVCKGLNRRPKQLRKGMDLTRVYSHLLSPPSSSKQQQRQTLVFSGHPDAQLHSLVAAECAGRNATQLVVRPKSYAGSAQLCPSGLVQRFRPVASDDDANEARLAMFTERIIPLLLDGGEGGGGTVLFVPDYLEFVRVRNAFKQLAAPRLRQLGKQLTPKEQKKLSLYEAICEYSSPSKVARARSLFFHGKTKVLIITERLHYYYRYRIRGIANLVFYSPPQHARFYAELAELTSTEVVTFYTPYEALELERVLGTQRTKRALAAADDASKEVVVVCE